MGPLHVHAARLVVRRQALAPPLRRELEHRHRAPHHLLSHGQRFRARASCGRDGRAGAGAVAAHEAAARDGASAKVEGLRPPPGPPPRSAAWAPPPGLLGGAYLRLYLRLRRLWLCERP